MSITKRDLQRRYGLRQSSPPENLMHHFHAKWEERHITLLAGDLRYNSLVPTATGVKVLLNPIDLMYVVQAKLILTTTFSGGGDSYYVAIKFNDSSYSNTFTAATSFENEEIDLKILMIDFFKKFTDSDFYIQVAVSNTSNPVVIHGAYLQFTIYLEDSYGDYANVVAPMLTDKSIVDKEFIHRLAEVSKDFQYISGIVPK